MEFLNNAILYTKHYILAQRFLMLSILIPTYKYNVYELAKALETQALKLSIAFELICIDDGSFSDLNKENQRINTLTHCKFIENKKNQGQTKVRHELASMAQYKWLLFMDADMMPKNSDFLETFISNIDDSHDLLFGGIAYQDNQLKPNHELRWIYGKNREEKSLLNREKKPYLSVISGCFLIQKPVFLESNNNLLVKSYGLDLLFTSNLKAMRSNVKHINNPVIHLGIESSEHYLEKNKKAISTYFELIKEHNHIIHSSLLKTYKRLKFFGLCSVFGNLTQRFNKRLEKNLKSSDPSLMLFDLYRLGYLCRLKK